MTRRLNYEEHAFSPFHKEAERKPIVLRAIACESEFRTPPKRSVARD